MIREEVQKLIHEGNTDEAARSFEEFGCGLTPEAILLELRNWNAKQIFETFVKVLDFTAKTPVVKHNTEVLRKHLTTFIPSEVVDSESSVNDVLYKAIPDYLESWEDCTLLFNELWETLKLIGRDDLTIGVAWASFLHLSF